MDLVLNCEEQELNQLFKNQEKGLEKQFFFMFNVDLGQTISYVIREICYNYDQTVIVIEENSQVGIMNALCCIASSQAL